MLNGDFVTFALKLVLEVFGIDASTLVQLEFSCMLSFNQSLI